ncbi:lysophospholipase nte1 [Trichodelitschia bisporula]|uniref:Lysophospholipase NTE1 n=1 Tax=Trichodelitschia bisporula TaxID=703511 RepID=A0A6G1HQP1_9PEZI|nr:lysophospholipase nte1 [Trichodelitschia bisporula]
MSQNVTQAAAAAHATAAVAKSADTNTTFGLFAWVILSVLRVIPGLLYHVVTFTTITIPTWLYRVLSISLTVTVNFSTLAFIGVACLSTVSYLVRYRYHTYARLPAEPPRKEPEVEVFPDPQSGDAKPGLSNYLDEFLSAIKVFGYLERHVFHELTRTMQTRKLVAGETVLLEDENGFCLVVEGAVQIFVRSRRDEYEAKDGFESDDESSPPGNRQGYQLITEVKNGAPMSSLFSILSLFTEDVKLKHGDDEPPASAGFSPTHVQGDAARSQATPEPNTPLQSPVNFFPDPRQGSLHRRTQSNLASPAVGGRLPIPPLTLDPTEDAKKSRSHVPHNHREYRRHLSAHPDIVARAAVDSTIAIIPASAFKRLTKMYPRATAHIINVILTRFYRVTLVTGHQYLGLTQEILRTEKLMNQYTTCDLPDYLRDSALVRLKEKFAKERERIGPDERMKGLALHNPRVGRRRGSSSALRKEASLQARLAAARSMGARSPDTPFSEIDRVGISAGDLLANGRRFSFSQPLQTPMVTRRGARSPLDQSYFRPRTMKYDHQESVDESEIFREAILECMFKVIGLTNINNLPKPESTEHSPRLVSFDSRRQKAVFSNGFGFDQFDGSTEADSESVASAPLSSASTLNPQKLVEDMINELDIVYFDKGSVLVEQQERLPGLYYVIDGFLEVSITVEEESKDYNIFGTAGSTPDGMPTPLKRVTTQDARKGSSHHGSGKPSKPGDKRRLHRQSLFLQKPGSLAGYLPAVSSYRSFVDVTAKSDVIVGFLPRSALERLIERYPIILLTLAKRLTCLLDRMILHLDFALEYLQVNAGNVIYNQGEQSDSIYIVLNGRLRAIQEQEDKPIRVLGEYGQGDSVGELEVLSGTIRPGSLHAIRDTELAKVPRVLFNSLAQEHPGVTMRMSKILARRMRALMEERLAGHTTDRTSTGPGVNHSSTANLRTVCIMPVTSGVPVVDFAARLVNALAQIGTSVVSLNQAAILNHLGRHAFSKVGKLKLSQYLADLEEKYGLVLYVADTTVQSPWTSTCITQSDCILLVAVADASPAVGEYERFLLTTKTTARRELILLHTERLCPPGLTRKWLQNRMWINGGHHHMQMAFKTSPEPVHQPNRRFGSALKQRVQVIQAEIQKYTSRKVPQTPLYSAETPFKGDFHRLARRLCGKSVGLVLGGGGARGIAHVGVIRALEEAGIPIDMIGGTSIGAFIGALYAWDAGIVPMYGRIKRFAGRMGSMWRFALDLTYPSASYTTGHEFNRGIFKTFGNYSIEDFWLPFYCNTTNISKSRMEYHTSGYAWRYIRASMSLAGLLPPLCDEGSMLLDGGYIDNLTVVHMKSLGADVIFAVDVGSLDDNAPQEYGDSLSGFWSLFNRWNPFSVAPNPPTLSDIQSRLAYVSSVDALERAKNMPGCHYMRPAIDPFGTLQFGSFDEIYRVGYEYGKEYLAHLKEQRVLPLMEESEEKKNLRRTTMARRASI